MSEIMKPKDLARKIYNDFSDLRHDIDSMELQITKLEKAIAILGKSNGNLIHHFHRYGMEEESLVLLMEVEKSLELIREVKELLGEKEYKRIISDTNK